MIYPRKKNKPESRDAKSCTEKQSYIIFLYKSVSEYNSEKIKLNKGIVFIGNKRNKSCYY